MSKELSHVEFYFPEGEFSDKEAIADAVVDAVEDNISLDYCGFLSKENLRESMMNHMGHGSIDWYRPITAKEEERIRDIIISTVEKCDGELSVPTENFIFVDPFFPDEDSTVFEGVMGVASYSCVFHLFVNLSNFSEQSLIDTVAHELNHTIYLYHHYDNFDNHNLLDSILMEGLAENFKEAFFTPESTPWAGALEEAEAFEILQDSKDLLFSTDEKEMSGFIHGKGEAQKRWMGYSVGYWLVKRFIAQHPELSWDEIMKLDQKRFLSVAE
jgi:hypothetical protein